MSTPALHVLLARSPPPTRGFPMKSTLLLLLLDGATSFHLASTLSPRAHGASPRAVVPKCSDARADFSGEWEMDLGSSDSLGPVLRALGLNRVLAAVVARVGVSQSITQSANELTVVVTTKLSTSTLRMPYDGSSVLAPGVTGGETPCVSRWLDDSQFETRQSLDASSPSSGSAFVTVRSLRDGGNVLVEAVSVLDDFGQLVDGTSAERLLRRK